MDSFFTKRVDFSRLSRDYNRFPLSLMETPNKEDVRYLFFELKFSTTLIGYFFNKSRPTVDKWVHNFGFVRPKEDLQVSKELTLKYKYGEDVSNSLQVPGALDKLKESNKKYGNDYHNHSKSKQTKLERYGDENYNNAEKHKQTCLERFGVDSFSKTQEFHHKKNKTNIERYGRTNVGQFGTQEHTEAMIKKYGAPYLMQTEYGIKQHAKACQAKYGVDNYFQSQEYKDKYKNEDWVKNIKEKEYNTKQANNSFTTSTDEDIVYNLLVEKFGADDIKRPYRSELYPYNCDFYILSKDLYVEYQGSWTHGNEPFEATNPKHKSIIEHWLKKSQEDNFKGVKKSFYSQAIYVWTELDVRKRETAKVNNLNFKELWNINQVKEWLTQQECL